MDILSQIRKPVAEDLARYERLFDSVLDHEDDFLGRALQYVRSRKGKMMRPLLVLLIARECGAIGEKALHSAVTLELLHTASLVHDDVVDESNERRGQASVNAVYGNQISVLVGDYLLSKSLQEAAFTGSLRIVDIISCLGGTLSEGEIFQIANIRSEQISEEAYFRIIDHKTAALFAACAELGALSADAGEDFIEKARRFGEIVGICFQIRDDIFDYYSNSEIGKPTGRDMAEGKLTLPVIYALKSTNDAEMLALADKVKKGEADRAEIETLIAFAKQNGGIEYAERKMQELRSQAYAAIASFKNEAVRKSLEQYIDFVIDRQK